jgi:Amt family ammonium transporter
MQAGFTMLETGLVRAKNSVNIAMKNVLDFLIATIFFYALGFALMFGEGSVLGLFGTQGFFLSGFSKPDEYTLFIFQLMFAGTAATIVSGSVAERMSFKGYALISLLVTALIYPVSGHWIWNSEGWLAQMGFMDFAGSTVVHSLGAWIGLVGTFMIGARHGRFDKNGKPKDIPHFNLTLVTLGVFLLWFGWFGFNGGSTLEANNDVPLILLNTILASAAGGFGAFMISMFKENHASVSKMLNGILGALVGITAGCAYTTPEASLFIGLFSGIIVYIGEDFLLKLKIDDPVSAVSVHGFAGAFGTLIIPFVVADSLLSTGSTFEQFKVQLIGVLAVMGWSVITAIIIFAFLKKAKLLRISLEDEMIGLNISEHGVKMSWLDTINTTKEIIEKGDYTKRVEVESQTEAGEVAEYFNDMLDDLQDKIHVLNKISKGELEVEGLNPKSNQDILSHSMGTMIVNLKDMMENLEYKQEELQNLNNDLEDRVDQRTKDLSSALGELEHANSLVIESIQYASRIQHALLPEHKTMDTLLGDHFCIWNPKDIVSGDFYMIEETPDGFIAIVADCTGHGVPGALMTMVAVPALHRIINELEEHNPSSLLTLIHNILQTILEQKNNKKHLDEGLEAAIIKVDVSSGRAIYSGAGIPMFYTKDGEVEEIRADRRAIGSKRTPKDYVFKEHEITLKSGMGVYMASDGLAEQVGWINDKKTMFGKKRFKQLIQEVQGLDVKEQENKILSTLERFMDIEKPRDDLTLLHFKI